MKRIYLLFLLLLIGCSSSNLNDKRFEVFKLYEAGNYQEALDKINILLKEHPDKDDLFYLRSRIFYKTHKFENSEIDISQAIKLNPLEADYFFMHGEIYLKMQKFNLALNEFKSCVLLDTMYSDAYKEIASILSQNESHDSALLFINKAIKINEKAEFFNRKGIIEDAVGNDSEAVKSYTIAIHKGYNDASVFRNRGIAYANLQQYDQALKDFNESILRDSLIASSFFNRGIVYYKLNLLNKACADWIKGSILGDPKSKAATIEYCKNKKV